jgi:hypothetical protein
MTRQRRYQLRHRLQGLCTLCPKPAVSANHCLRHLQMTRGLKRAAAGNRPWRPGGPGRPPFEGLER